MRFKKLKTKILAMGLATASVAAPFIAPLAQPVTTMAADTDANVKTGWYEIKAKTKTSMNLDVEGKTAKNGANVVLWGDYNMSNQRFYIKNLGKGIYQILTGTGTHSLALDVMNGEKKGNVRQWTNNNSNAQRWRIFKNSDGSVSFQNVSSGHFLDIVNGTTNNGTNIRVWERNNSNAQKFKLEYVCAAGKLPTNPTNINGWYRISPSRNTGYSLDVNGNNYNAGANITLYQNNSSDAQKFYIKHIGNGEYVINTGTSHQTGNIDVHNTSKNGNIKQWTATNSSAQKFRIYKFSDGSYGFYNIGTSHWIDIAGDSAYKNFTNVQVYKYLGNNGLTAAEGQGFKLASVKSPGTYTTVKNGWYEIHPKTKGTALLDVSGGKTANSTNIQIYQKHNVTPDAQKFYFQQVSGYDYIIYTGTENKKKALDVTNSKSNGNVIQYQAHKGNNQIWRIVKNTDGYYTFINKATYQALDMVDGKTTNGTNVRVWQTNGADAQRWSINAASTPKSAQTTTTTTTTTNSSATVGKTQSIQTGLRATATDGNRIMYSKITGIEPKLSVTGWNKTVNSARNLGARVAINGGMWEGNGIPSGVTYTNYGKSVVHSTNSYNTNNRNDELVLRTNGWLDSITVQPNTAGSLGIRWAVKGNIVLIRNGVDVSYATNTSRTYSFLAQDYNGVYYIGAFIGSPFSVMKASLRKIIPNIKFAYALDGGGSTNYVENGTSIYGGDGRSVPNIIWF